MSDDYSDPEAESDVRTTTLTVALVPETIDNIDEEIERQNEQSGEDYSREQFARHAILDQLERLEGERWRDE